MIAEDLGLKLENITVQQLGRAKRVVITKDNTTIIDGQGKKDDLQMVFKNCATAASVLKLTKRP